MPLRPGTENPTSSPGLEPSKRKWRGRTKARTTRVRAGRGSRVGSRLPLATRSRAFRIRAVSGAGIAGAIVALASASENFEVAKTLKGWVETHPAIAVGIVAVAIAIDDLALRFSRLGVDSERGRQRDAAAQRVKYLAFISTSSGEESFYSLIFNHLVQYARSLSDSDMRLLVIPWFPKQSFDVGKELRDDIRALRRVNNFEFSGIFVIPDNPDSDFTDLTLLKEVSGNIVFLDVNFDPDNRPASWSPCFVGGDEVVGGAIAAEIAGDYAQAIGALAPRVLVLVGRSTPWESQRYRSFETEFSSRFPASCIGRSEGELMYSRHRAREYVYRRLRVTARECLPDILFACNDDMAIGAHDAIRRLVREGILTESSSPRIVGYDGISEMLDLINDGDSLILGTVDVSVKHLAYHAMENMKYMLEGRDAVMREPQMRAIRALVPIVPDDRLFP